MVNTQLPYLDSWIIHENKWRATRYGLEANLIMNEHGDQKPIKSIIEDTIVALEPEINFLNLGESMDRIITRIHSNDMYHKKQIELYESSSDFKSVIQQNIDSLKK